MFENRDSFEHTNKQTECMNTLGRRDLEKQIIRKLLLHEYNVNTNMKCDGYWSIGHSFAY